MDNFRIDVTCEGEDSLSLVMKLAFRDGRKARGYRVSKEKGLILYWSINERVTAFPFGLDAEAAAKMVSGWLAEQDYGREPNHDGDNGKGWRVYNEDWGQVDSEWQAFLAVKPVWAMYGK